VVADCISIRGSFVGNREDMAEALSFAADGKVKADIELQPLSAINEVFTRLEHGDVPARVVLQDIPSGVQGDTGENLGAVESVLTVTCFRKKPGHLLFPGRGLCGETRDHRHRDTGGRARRDCSEDLRKRSAVVARRATAATPRRQQVHARPCVDFRRLSDDGGGAHGGTRGSPRGCGFDDHCGARDRAADLRRRAHQHHGQTAVGAGDFDALLDDARVTAFLIGPGAGVGEATRKRTLAMLATRRATLIDADAISSFKEDPAELMQGDQRTVRHDAA
jgi:hypothetical protein